VIAHMTAHFRGGPWHEHSKYMACEKDHGHTIQVQEILPLYDHLGHYEVDGDPVSCEAFGELLVDVVYTWSPWADPDGP
jgi:hypothetical protein